MPVNRALAEVLAVADQHDEPAARRVLAEGGRGDLERLADAGPRPQVALADRRALHQLARRLDVRRQREAQVCAAGEGHQPDAIPLEPVEELAHQHLRVLEAVRLHVSGEHTGGDIQRDDHVRTLARQQD